MRRLLLTTCLISLSGCATLSFAPPQVRKDRAIHAKNQQTFFNAVCTPDHADTNEPIEKNVKGALALIENYVLTYGCQADRAAEGKQFFEVPGFLVGAGAATAAAFGAPAGLAIGAGATQLVLGQGSTYYAPKDKAVVFRAAVDALNCINREAVGIDTSTLQAINDAQTGKAQGGQSGTAVNGQGNGATPPQAPGTPAVSVTVPSETMYFQAVQTAIVDVENTVRSRLVNVGKPFDGAGVVAQIKQLGKEVEDAKQSAGDATEAGDQLKKAVTPAATDQGFVSTTGAQQKVLAMDDKQLGQVVIDVRTLAPKLAQCAVQAKV